MSKLAIGFIFSFCFFSACSTHISGTVQLLDENNIPLANADYQQITINIIQINSSNLNDGATSLTTNESGFFSTKQLAKAMTKGKYKIEAFKQGFTVDSKEIELKNSESLDFKLKRFKDIDMKAFKETSSEMDVSNSEGVSIQPPL